MAPFYQPGNFIGRVTHQALTETSTGKPSFNLTCQIVEEVDQFGTSCPVDKSYERTVYSVITEKTMPRFLEFLKLLGFNKMSLKFLDPNTSGFCDFTGQDVPLWCKHEEYEGELKEKWNVSLPRGEREPAKPLEANQVRKLDALFGKALKEFKQADVNKEAATANAGAEDDCPF